MTKIRVAVVAVVLLLLLGLPPVFGMLTESQIGRYVESLRERQLDVTIDEYERSWFSSRAQITAVPAQPDPSAAVSFAAFLDPVTVAVDIQHGPVSVKNGFFLGLSKLGARPVDGAEPRLDFAVEAQMTFGGTVHFVADVPPFRYEAERATVTLSGGRASGTVAGRHIDARGTIESLQAVSSDGTLSMIGIRASSDSERLSRGLTVGTMSVEINRVSFEQAAASPAIDASGVVFESRSNLDASRERLSAQASLAVERARAGSESTITDARYEMSLRNIDAEAFEAYYDLVARTRSAEPSVDEMEPIVQRVLAGAPSFAVDTLRFSFDGQPFEASVHVDVDSSALPAGRAALHDPAFWTAILRGRAELTAAKPLVERIAAAAIRAQLGARQEDGAAMPGASLDALAQAQVGLALGMLSAQGMIEDTGSLYRTTVSFDSGQLAINGQPLPFPMF